MNIDKTGLDNVVKSHNRNIADVFSPYDDIPIELKLEINRLIWENSPETVTLKQAEDMAVYIGEIIITGKLPECLEEAK